MSAVTFSERLNVALEERNISPAELSRQSGASEGLISGYRKGKYKAKQDRLEAFARILDVSIPWLMGGDVPMGHYDCGSYSPSNILPVPRTSKIPLLGTIACGEPLLAEENIEDEVDLPEHIRADFALRCKGDSMINARIFDGDIVYIHQCSEVANGKIAAVRVGDEATLKRVYYFPDDARLVLRPCNLMYSDMIYTGPELEDIEIIGEAVAFTSLVRHE